jgi:hypothetical protein
MTEEVFVRICANLTGNKETSFHIHRIGPGSGLSLVEALRHLFRLAGFDGYERCSAAYEPNDFCTVPPSSNCCLLP